MTIRPDEPALRVDHGVTLMCSSRGCRSSALWGLKWNNPALHTEERRKVWLACDIHRETLESFLTVRGFLRDTVPVAELRPE
jgi:hypothetical protein